MVGGDELLYEYAVVRYVPRIDREEFINIGLLMLSKRNKWLHGQIELDKMRLKAFDPEIKFEALEKQALMFEKDSLPFKDFPAEEKYRWLTAQKSAILQTSPSHPGILVRQNEKETVSSLLENEFLRLFSELVSL